MMKVNIPYLPSLTILENFTLAYFNLNHNLLTLYLQSFDFFYSCPLAFALLYWFTMSVTPSNYALCTTCIWVQYSTL